ncbi:MAG: hypothetical protein CV089_17465 [Nitrospira sp. WS110]|nr:hypothetical protein [Nitrospira sp. WS110]
MNGSMPKKALTATQFPLADVNDIIDNAPTMSREMKSRSPVRRLESCLISLGMSVFAYLLEKMILRSVKGGKAKS